jgi:hypothetical protein
MINMERDHVRSVAVRSSHAMTIILDNDATAAFANLLANLDHVAPIMAPNHMEHLIELRKQAFGY